MPVIDLCFSLAGTEAIPADHGYHLYSAISRLLPVAHAENGMAIHPIRGRQIGGRKITLLPTSRLVVRAKSERIPELLPLAGKSLNVAGAHLRVGVPQVFSLSPTPALRSRLVTIKLPHLADESDDAAARQLFTDAVRRKLDGLNVSPEALITLAKRRTLRIKRKEVVGYEVLLEGLTADESLNIQENGDPHNPHSGFSRRHMGCGVFVPLV